MHVELRSKTKEVSKLGKRLNSLFSILYSKTSKGLN
jgi:hypothetical protein